MAGKDNYYKTLGLKLDATQAEIKSRFRKLAKQFHPDNYFHPSQKIWATKQFQKLVEAYETLSEPQKRKEYDETFKVIDIPTGETYNVSKDIFYYWWLRVYLYYLPLFLSHLIHLLTGPIESQISISDNFWFILLYAALNLLLPWVLLGLFPPFWCALSTHHTKNMGCMISILMWGGLALGMFGVIDLLFNLKTYQMDLVRIPIPIYFIILFYVISLVVFFLVGAKQNLVYPILFLGLTVAAICAIRSFMKSDWTYFFLFCFYSAICIDSLVSRLFYEYLRRKLKKIEEDLDLQQLLLEE